MNKFLIITKGVIIAMGMIGLAYADNPSANHSLLNNWTGFYTGINAELAFNNSQLQSKHLGFTNQSDNCNNSSDFRTLFPGIHVGYLYQFANYLVSGIEANATFNTKQKILNCRSPFNSSVYDRFIFKEQLQKSFKARVGRTLNWNKNILLPYVTTGVSFVNAVLTYKNEGGDYYSENNTAPGWLIGAGLEWAFKENWSLRLEYAYINFGNAINLKIPGVYGLIDTNGKAHVDLSSKNVVLTINYWI